MPPTRDWCRGAARPVSGASGAGQGSRLQCLHRAQRGCGAAPGDLPPRAALGPRLVARGCRRHLRLHRGLGIGAEGGCPARRHDRDRVADLFRAAACARGTRPEGPRTADGCAGRRRPRFARARTRAKIGGGLPVRLELQQPARLHDARSKKARIAATSGKTRRAIYGDIYFGGERPKPFGALDPAADTLYCSSFSKTIAPGYRIGWLVAGQRMQAVLRQKLASTLATPALTQAALADLLSCGGYDSHLRRIRRVFADNIDRMTRAIERSFPEGTRVSRPAGGFVLWVELPQPADTRVLFEEAVKRGICFAPGDVYSASSRYRHCLRLSCGYSWDRRIEAGVEAIGALVGAPAGLKAI